jgi:hypothetical protein
MHMAKQLLKSSPYGVIDAAAGFFQSKDGTF